MKQVLISFCLFSLVLGFPVLDSDSDSSDNAEVKRKSSESSLQSSEQQHDTSEEFAAVLDLDPSAGAGGEDNEARVSLKTDNDNSQGEVSEDTGGEENGEEDHGFHTEEHHHSSEDLKNEDTTSDDHNNEDDHGESGSNEDLDGHNQSIEIHEADNYQDNENTKSTTESSRETKLHIIGLKEPSEEGPMNRDLSNSYSEENGNHDNANNVLNEEKNPETLVSTDSDFVTGVHGGKSEDDDDDYEDDVNVIAGDSKENQQNIDCDNDILSKEYDSDGEKMQNDDSNVLLSTNSDSTMNTDTANSSSKEKKQRVVKKNKRKKTSKKSSDHVKKRVKTFSRRVNLDAYKDDEDNKSRDPLSVESSSKSSENTTNEDSLSQEGSQSNEGTTPSKDNIKLAKHSRTSKEVFVKGRKLNKNIKKIASQIKEDVRIDLEENVNQSSEHKTQSTEKTESNEDVLQSPEDTTESDEDPVKSEEDVSSAEDSTESVKDPVLSDEDATQSAEDTIESLENGAHPTSSVDLSHENLSGLRSIESHSNEYKILTEDKKQLMEKNSKSTSVEDVKDSMKIGHQSTQDNSDSQQHSSAEIKESSDSEENSENIDSKQSDSKSGDTDTTLEKISGSESSENNKSFKLRSMTHGNSSLQSESNSKSNELGSDSREDNNDDSVTDWKGNDNLTLEDDESQSRESAESESREKKQSISSESEDVSRASLSFEIDSRRLMFGVYQRKAIGNDNDCQDGY
uniref:Dentin sialophosphoprotein-like n=1 Tax=Leptobrachium leishanense TaxID=445787 RepID=A0A8C5MSE9_9ANUR